MATFGNSFTRTQVSSSIIAGNTATTDGNDVSSPPVPDPDVPVENSFVSLGFNLIGDGQFTGVDFFTDGTGGDIVGTKATPVDPLLGPLADNGGPTLTHALLAGSSALNAGDPSFASPPDFDQRGIGFPRVQLVRIDIGAFEAASFLPPQGLIVSTTSDVVDGDFSVGQLSLREAILVANAVAGTDTITFDSTVFTGGLNSLIRLGGMELTITESLTIDGSSATGVMISADAEGNDTPISGTFITDVDASDSAGTLNDNSRVINFSAASGDLTLNNLTITGGRTTGESDGGGGIFSIRRRDHAYWQHDQREQHHGRCCAWWRNLFEERRSNAQQQHRQREQDHGQYRIWRWYLGEQRRSNAYRQHRQWQQHNGPLRGWWRHSCGGWRSHAQQQHGQWQQHLGNLRGRRRNLRQLRCVEAQ